MNILFISLGCDKNLVDSEVMLGILAKDGHQMVDDETMADVIIINTCCFIHDAKEESIQNILEMAEQIPMEVRIITILDIFDALVADDRPYKPGMPVEKALGILDIMADKEGKLDPELTRLFRKSRCWEKD